MFQVILCSCDEENKLCRDRLGLLPPERFKLRTCTMCYLYLFPQTSPLGALPPTYEYLVPRSSNLTGGLITGPIAPDVTNQTTRQLICNTLSQDQCSRQAISCMSCLYQISVLSRLVISNDNLSQEQCSRQAICYMSCLCQIGVGYVISNETLSHCNVSGRLYWFHIKSNFI